MFPVDKGYLQTYFAERKVITLPKISFPAHGYDWRTVTSLCHVILFRLVIGRLIVVAGSRPTPIMKVSCATLLLPLHIYASADPSNKLMNKSLTVLEVNKIIVQQVIFEIS